MGALELRDGLIAALSSDGRIMGIGQTGSMDVELVPGKSDVDLFVLCSEIPREEERRKLYHSIGQEDCEIHMEVCRGGRWGYGDILVTGGIDVMPMYFTIREMKDYLCEILSCGHLEKEGRFYPVGRLASVSTIHILYEKERAWSGLKEMVNQKPKAFFRAWYQNEISRVLDEEDLGRAELRREVLFFHQVLENALDHLLQALYAVNGCYFPSRKRTVSAIGEFLLKPADCTERLLRMVRNSTSEETMAQSIAELRALTEEVRELGYRVFGRA